MYALLMVTIRMFTIALHVTEGQMCLCQEHGCNARLYLLFIYFFIFCLSMICILYCNYCLFFVYTDQFSVYMSKMRASWKISYYMYSHLYMYMLNVATLFK